MSIEIEMPDKKSVRNFVNWFRKEGFQQFTNSKFNTLNKRNTDSYITCLATDDKLATLTSDEMVGHYFELQ